jgi:uncharacterized paraquat-inducible protein A
MPELTPLEWGITGLLVVVWLMTAARMALLMHQRGHNFALWMVVTTLATALPATLVLRRERLKQSRRAHAPAPQGGSTPGGKRLIRCERCGERFGPEEVRGEGAEAVCPRCGLPMGPGKGERLA